MATEHDEQVSQLKNKLLVATQERTVEKEKEREVMRGLVEKLQLVTEEKNELSKLLKEASKAKTGGGNNTKKTQKNIASLNNQIEELLLEKEETKKSLLLFMTKADETERALEEVQQKLKEKEKEALVMRETAQEVCEAKAKEKALEQLQTKVREMESTAESIKESNEALAIVQQQVYKERTEKETLEKELSQVAAAKAESELHIAAFKAQIEDLNEKLSAKEQLASEIKAWTDEKQAWTDEKKMLEETLRQEKAKIVTAETLVETLKADQIKLHNVQEQLQEYEAAKNEATSKAVEGQTAVKGLQGKLNEANESLSVIKQMLNERDVEIDTSRKETIAARATLTELEEKSKKLVVMLNKTKKQMIKLEKDKSDTIEEADTAKKQLEKAQLHAAEMIKSEAVLKAEASRLTSKIQTIEAEVRILQKERREALEQKNQMFDELQMKQAEFESSQSNAENLQHRLKESERQLQEAEEKAAAYEEYQWMAEEANKKMKELEGLWNEQKQALELSVEENSKTVLELKTSLTEKQQTWDNQSTETAAQLAHIQESLRKSEIESIAKSKDLDAVQEDRNSLLERIRLLETDFIQQKNEYNKETQSLKHLRKELALVESTRDTQIKELESSMVRESHLKTLNKTLQDEIRKLSRPPSASTTRLSTTLIPTSPSLFSVSEHNSVRSGASTPTGSEAVTSSPPSTPRHKEDEINLEYLRNVVIKFLEVKSTRVQLIPVLTMMLKFTPEEIKRLQAKA